jgi:hypothetical protein
LPVKARGHRRAATEDTDAPPADGCLEGLLAGVEALAEDHWDAGRVTVPPPEAGVLDCTPFGLVIATPPARLEGLSDVVEAVVRPTSNRLPDRHECRPRGTAFDPTL